MVNEMFNGMFGKIAHGMCRLSMNGGMPNFNKLFDAELKKYGIIKG